VNEREGNQEVYVRRAITFVLACIAATVLPAASGVAGNGKGEIKRLAVKQCQAERSGDRAAFRALYGKNAMRNCIRENRSEIRTARRDAVRECKAERSEDIDQFREDHGTNSPRGEKAQGTKRNAFGKCVRSKVRAEIRESVAELRSAARECREERSANPADFREKYGTNAPKGENAQGAKRNAFGKCVSSKVRDAENGNGNGENGNGV
jgi:hypothetical protein